MVPASSSMFVCDTVSILLVFIGDTAENYSCKCHDDLMQCSLSIRRTFPHGYFCNM